MEEGVDVAVLGNSHSLFFHTENVALKEFYLFPDSTLLESSSLLPDPPLLHFQLKQKQNKKDG